MEVKRYPVRMDVLGLGRSCFLTEACGKDTDIRLTEAVL